MVILPAISSLESLKQGISLSSISPAEQSSLSDRLLDTRIADLNRRIEQLSAYIDHVTVGPEDGDIDVDQYARLLSLHGQLTSRLGRLLRDKQQISPEDDSLLQQAINNALDQASEILGVQL